MKKVNIGRNVSIYPMPVTLVGSMVEEKPNFMAVAWITRVNATPPLLAVSLNKPRYTAKGILENKTFSVNFPGVNMVEQTDYCGLASGRESDKSGLFEVFYGDDKSTASDHARQQLLESRGLRGSRLEHRCQPEEEERVIRLQSFYIKIRPSSGALPLSADPGLSFSWYRL